VLVQIYGLTTPDDAALVDGLGPDHAGVVLDEGIDTWDSVEEPVARAIVARLRAAKVVGLSLSPIRPASPGPSPPPATTCCSTPPIQ
jgi:phosphoribosylanthranilate isomerase